jgi:hypothetical protein
MNDGKTGDRDGKDFLGQELPGGHLEAFSPAAFTSLGPWVESVDFSPDCLTCLVGVGSADYANASLHWCRRREGLWTEFEPVPFAKGFAYSNEPVFLNDGRTLLFTAALPGRNRDLWFVNYNGESWGQPVRLPPPVNSDADEFRGSYASDGTLFFGSYRSGGMKIYKAMPALGGNYRVETVGPPVSIGPVDGDPCISPSGDFLIFYTGRDRKSAKLVISFADGEGGWLAPTSLGFDSAEDSYGAHFSAGGRVLFFTRHGKEGNTIQWISSSFLQDFRRAEPSLFHNYLK